MKTYYRKLWLVAVFAAIGAVSIAQVKQPATKALPSIKKLMSHDDFTKTGLTKLSEEEIKALDEWLQNYTQEIAKALTTKPGAAATADVIETHIDGDFEGWDGETIWKMDNGQIWQQASYAYHYHYAYHPKVLIYRTTAGWKMKVDGDEEVSVKRIK